MNEQRFRWRNKQLRDHADVIDGKLAPTKVLKHITYLNVFLKQWMTGNIWILEDRIVYVGMEMPANLNGTEIIEGKGEYAVPGYIEPHAHPFQLYNPQSLAEYAAWTGTTTIINDNLMWLFLTGKKKAFSLLEEFMKLPTSMFWWGRFDAQTSLRDEKQDELEKQLPEWFVHDAVIQGGELTAWPDVLYEKDDQILHWMQEVRKARKRVEGHLPGASESTLVKMKLLGLDGDHESMTADEVIKRVELGYQAGVRHSSIRPDLPKMMQGLVEKEFQAFDRLMYTTDGSTPGFYNDGVIDKCIDIAIKAGVPEIEAYLIATRYPAHHFGIDERLGALAPGHIAHINLLESTDNPTPHSVIAKGEWIKKNHEDVHTKVNLDWESAGITPLSLDWTLEMEELQFSMPVGMDMVNDVIMKPYAIESNASVPQLPEDTNEAFLMLLDREGTWKVNTLLRGFTTSLGALSSSFSSTGDLILLGKSKEDMLQAFHRMKEIGGGIVLVQDGEVIFEMPLAYGGMMSDEPLEKVIEKEAVLKKKLCEHGYCFGDPVYTLLFLSSTHLPYVRITPLGLMDVKNKEVLFPAIMR
ncbi:adenine deaminase C-terminal domain-containing protein [Salimicrobium flavidum]|uniref:adenine deaminase n=1 Tax=Salimicrobium flavidum TaxID=570947 RepID=A0A1N7KVJ3_9BACI|nr:adenine deaminase C-terminal domain-containing protein [Salimicrobium flavidum]SIS65629.1 Adenine deaminase [Salimicrobium flavidum]